MDNLKKLISEMSLEEKLGQMTMVISSWLTAEASELTGILTDDAVDRIDCDKVGSALGSITADSAVRIQQEHLRRDRLKIPLLLMRDVIHGFRTIYPIPLAMGGSFNPDIMERCCAMAAAEGSAAGLHGTFAPMVDCVRDARWGRVMESCGGEDPYLNAVMGRAQVRGFQGKGLSDPNSLITCVKHFAAYGAAEAGRDYNTTELSEYAMREYFLPAYQACIEAGSPAVMSSFNCLNGVPTICSKWLMQQVLRQEWGFDGVVISDWGGVEQIAVHGAAENLKKCAELAIKNQGDLELCSLSYWENAAALLADGDITTEQLDRSVYRILKLKEAAGLFKKPFHGASTEKEDALLLCPEHRSLARQAAEESAVLLKNNGVLPLSQECRDILLIGPFADTHEILGLWACDGRDEESVTVAQGVRNRLPGASVRIIKGCGYRFDDLDASGIDEAVEAAGTAECVILCVGEPKDYSGEGRSRADIRLPGMQEELVRRVCAVNQKAAVLLFHGRPLVLTGIAQSASAILSLWYPGTEGGNAAARLLFGDANPSGKLAMSFPQAVGQCPIYYNHLQTGRPAPAIAELQHVPFVSNYIDCGNLPLYSFGYGLSYTQFEYCDLQLSSSEMSRSETLFVDITVKNAGTRAGKEVVQLYLRDHVGSTLRPVQQLIAFKKVYLEVASTTTVRFFIQEKQLRMWRGNDRFSAEAGLFSVSTGYADHLMLTKQFCLVDDNAE